MFVRHAVRAVIVSLLVLLVGAGTASAATDHVVITGGVVVPAGQTAHDVIVLDGTVRIAGPPIPSAAAMAPERVVSRAPAGSPSEPDRPSSVSHLT